MRDFTAVKNHILQVYGGWITSAMEDGADSEHHQRVLETEGQLRNAETVGEMVDILMLRDGHELEDIVGLLNGAIEAYR